MPKNSQRLQLLAAESRKLAAQEKWIAQMLNKIKSYKMALEVERLQLNSIIRNAEKSRDLIVIDKSLEGANIDVKLLDFADSSLNTKQLNLSVCNDLAGTMDTNGSEVEESEDELMMEFASGK